MIGTASRPSVSRRFRAHGPALLGLGFLALVVAAAVLAPVVTRYDPGELGPLSRARPSVDHWFGTDVLGRDVFARVVYGARVSLTVGILAVLLASTLGLLVGAASGYHGGWLDGLLMRTADVFLAFPYILGAMVVIAVTGRGTGSLVLVLGLLGWMPIARLVRAGVLQTRQADYVVAAHAAGGGTWRLLVRHILPNSIQPVVVYATLFVGTAVLAEAALSFLGAGVDESTPAWGLMVAQGRTYLSTSPHLLFFPSAAIVLTVMAFVLVGDGLRAALDPRSAS